MSLTQPLTRPLTTALSRAISAPGVGGGLAVLPEYEGIVATRGIVPNRQHVTNTKCMSQSKHIARGDLSAVKLVISNWALILGANVVETNGGGQMDVTASISTDRTNWVRVTFGGVDTGNIANGDNIVSDACSISLSDGQAFWVRIYRAMVAGTIIYSETIMNQSTNFELFRIGTTIDDATDGSAFVSNGAFFLAPPTAIIGQTTKPSVLLLGDSIVYGFDDDYQTSATGDIGKLAPSVGAKVGYIMSARSSDKAQFFAAGGAKRAALGVYASHAIASLGRNDLDARRSINNIKADIETIAGFYSIPVWWDTIGPRSTSTDAWATVANQTTVADNANRAVVNDWLRATPAFLAGVFDSCRALENDPVNNDGKWLPLTYTDDGTHPNGAGYAAVFASGSINPNRLR